MSLGRSRNRPNTHPFSAGLLLYHGTTSTAPFTALRAPAWLTAHRSVAEMHALRARRGTPRILVFRIVHSLDLFDASTAAGRAALFDLWDRVRERGVTLADAVCGRGYDGWIESDGDAMLCQPGETVEYVRTEAA